MYVRLFDCTARGVSLDELILGELEPYCNVRTTPTPQPRLMVREPAAGRRHSGEVSFNELYAADGPAIRNGVVDVDAGDSFPFIL
jgi:hypothetical protein